MVARAILEQLALVFAVIKLRPERVLAGGRLTTHVLDTANGVPAAGVGILLFRVSGNSHKKIAETVTNADGRTDAPLLDGADFKKGSYELIFSVGGYFGKGRKEADGAMFLDEVPVRFSVADASQHYHVPLLVSPFGYSTYRGS